MFSIIVKFKKNSKRSSKENLIGEGRIELTFYKTGYERVAKKIDILGLEKYWDNEKRQFKKGSPNYALKNKAIEDEKQKYYEVVEKWETEGTNWSPKMLSHYFDIEVEIKNNEPQISTVLQIIHKLEKKFLEKKRLKNGKIISSSSNARNYVFLRNSLRAFTQCRYNRCFSSYYFHHINEKFLTDYSNYLLAKGARNGNRGGLPHKLKLLRAVVNTAKRLDIPGVNLGAFESVEVYMKNELSEPKTVSYGLIEQIECLDRTEFTKCENLHIDLFLFSVYTGGMCNIDVCFLENKNINGNVIIYERMKVRKKAKALLTQKTKEILDKYKDMCYNDFALPIFNKRHNTEEKMYMRVRTISVKVNKTLRKVREKLGTQEKITWNSARGTFISKLLDEGYSPIVVAEMAGNSPAVIYKHYYKNTNINSILEGLNRIF